MLMASMRDSVLAATQLAQLSQLSQLNHHMMLAGAAAAHPHPHAPHAPLALPAQAEHEQGDAGAGPDSAGAGLGAGAGAEDRHSPPISRTYTYKKVTKPLLERKRRARINRCLDELKNLMVGALEAEGENVSKLEKADILELTVRHLQRITRPRDAAEDASRFQAGFSQCASEACHFLLGRPGLDAVGRRLVAHLSQVVSGLRPHGPPYSPPSSPAPPSLSLDPSSPEVSSSTQWGRLGKREREPEVDTEADLDSDDDPDSDGPVNYTSEALRRRREVRREGDDCTSSSRDRRVSSSSSSSSTSSTPGNFNGHISDDEERGPMWRPW